MREQLLGYLLGALEPHEQAAVEARLQSDPVLRAEFEALREKLLPLAEHEEPIEPPAELTDKTCRFVMSRLGPAACHFAGSHQWRLIDLFVAGGLLAACLMLVFPAIVESRTSGHLARCRSNLMTLGRALTEYSTLHDDYFPVVAPSGKLAAAGVYAPTLVDSKLICHEDVICPASALARQQDFRIPSLAELRRAEGAELARLQHAMGGSYGYGLGYVERGTYRSHRNLRRSTFALMADAPVEDSAGPESGHHGPRGMNVLFEDGHVRLMRSFRVGDDGDHIFRNGLGFVGAGVHRDDAVIGSSRTAPVVLHVLLEP
jgi:hypothetical protein